MATIPQAVETLIGATGLPRAAVECRARYLRDNGLLPKGKRGGGRFSAHLNADHLATLLVSVIASAEQTRVGEMTPRLMKSKWVGIIGTEHYSLKLDDEMTIAFGGKPWLHQSFGDVVAKLIEMAVSDEGKKLIDRYFVGLESSLVKERQRISLILKDRNQPAVTIKGANESLIASDKVQLKPQKAWVVYGEGSDAMSWALE